MLGLPMWGQRRLRAPHAVERGALARTVLVDPAAPAGRAMLAPLARRLADLGDIVDLAAKRAGPAFPSGNDPRVGIHCCRVGGWHGAFIFGSCGRYRRERPAGCPRPERPPPHYPDRPAKSPRLRSRVCVELRRTYFFSNVKADRNLIGRATISLSGQTRYPANSASARRSSRAPRILWERLPGGRSHEESGSRRWGANASRAVWSDAALRPRKKHTAQLTGQRPKRLASHCSIHSPTEAVTSNPVHHAISYAHDGSRHQAATASRSVQLGGIPLLPRKRSRLPSLTII